MNIVFLRTMTQKYRSIIHFIDPIIEAGHSLTICVNSAKFKLASTREKPTNVGKSSKGAIEYLAKNFGIKIKHIEKVLFTKKKDVTGDLYLLSGKHQKEKNSITLPYVKPRMITYGKDIVVGNPLCELIRDTKKTFMEVPGTLLLIHPGGGRGFISPVHKPIPKKRIQRHNYKFLNKIISNLPEFIDRVIIKTHPFPYHQCTKTAIEKTVLQELRDLFKNIRIYVVEDDLISYICQSEWILNFGSSTAYWLKGSGKKWVNVTGMARYKYKKHREDMAEKRGGAVNINNLKEAMINYNRKDSKEEIEIYNMDAIQNVMRFINAGAKI